MMWVVVQMLLTISLSISLFFSFSFPVCRSHVWGKGKRE